MSDQATSIGVDFGGTTIKMAVCRGIEIIRRAEPIDTQCLADTQSIIQAMCDCVRTLRVEYPDVVAVGLGIPGWVDFKNRTLGRLVNVPAFDETLPILAMMEEAIGLPVYMDNDANCMAYAEWKLGAGKGFENVVSLTLGTGIGGGIVINNQMLRSRGAAELGMCSIDYKGKPGPYGNRGGIEEYIGHNELTADAMARYAAAGIARSEEQCDAYQLELAAREGDAIAAQVYIDFAEKLACLIMNLMFSIAPDRIILGGGVSKAGDLLFDPLDRFLQSQLMPLHYRSLTITSAHFGTDAGLLGAAMMAVDESQKIS